MFEILCYSSGLRPLNNCNVGELTPVQVTEETHSSEDSLSVPSFSEVLLLFNEYLFSTY